MRDQERLSDLRHHLFDRRARTAASVRETLVELNPPDWLRKDFEVVIFRHLQIDAGYTVEMEQLAPTIQRFAARFGKALPQWVGAWRYLAENGCDKLLQETD